MAITSVNRKQKTYYLQQGKTKLGNPKYFFSMKSDGNLVEVIPEGFEIYETPNAQVFLRKIPPQFIFEEEVAIVENGMENYSKLEYFQVEVKKKTICIFTPNEDASALFKLFSSTPLMRGQESQKIQEYVAKSLTYADNLRFTLVDQQNRLFQTERYCYLGSIDDWIEVGTIGSLKKLVKTYVGHLGQDSFFDLM